MSNKELSLKSVKFYDNILTIKMNNMIGSLQIEFNPIECNFSVYLTHTVYKTEDDIKKYRKDYRAYCKLLSIKSDFIITDDNLSFKDGCLQLIDVSKACATTPITFEEYSNLITIFKLKGML